MTCPSVCPFVGGVFGKGNIYTTADVVVFHRPNDNWGRHIVFGMSICPFVGKMFRRGNIYTIADVVVFS